MNDTVKNTETTTTVAVEVKGLPAFRQEEGFIEATAKALMDRGLTINDKPAALTDISSMAKLGFIATVGVAEKVKSEDGKAVRGPNASVYRVPTNTGFFNVALR